MTGKPRLYLAFLGCAAVLGVALLALGAHGPAPEAGVPPPGPAASEATEAATADEGPEHDSGSQGDQHPGNLPVPDRAAEPSNADPAKLASGDTDAPTGSESGPVAAPARIEIPAIGVDEKIVPVSLLPDGAMEVPDFGLAGWYTKGPRPGEEGPSAVVAHVDSRHGPDVFFRLRELAPGDEVHIHREDGSSVTFTVEHQEQTPKDELPTDRIWGWTDEPTLRLLTCDGFFDNATGHYVDNRIVYLSLATD